MANTKNPDLLWKLLHLLPVFVLCVHCILHRSYTSAETATLLCYARTFVEGGGIALQADAIQSHGFASLLWLLILAAAGGLGLSVLACAKVIGIVLAGTTLTLLPRISRALNGRTTWRPVDLLAPSLLALHPAMGLHAASGLETSLSLLLVAIALLLFAREERDFGRGKSCGAGSAVPLILLFLVLPEAPALAGALMLGRILSHATAGRAPSGRAWLWLGLLPAAGLLYAVWCYVTFADPWPGLSASQAAEVAGLETAETVARGWGWAGGLGARWGLSLPLLLVASVGALRPRCYWVRIAIVALCMASLYSVVAAGGDAELGRRALPMALGLLILVGEGLDCLIARLEGLLGGRTLRRGVAFALLCGVVALPVGAAIRLARHPPPSPWRDAMSRVKQVRDTVESSGWAPRQVRVLTASPGAFAWQRFRVLDITGRTDPVVRRIIEGQDRQALRRLIFHERQPDVLVERLSRRALHGFTRYPEARRGYVTPETGDGAVSYSRRLLLEPAPWGDEPMRAQVAPHLWLLGVRVVPRQLVLLWMTDRTDDDRGDAVTNEVELGMGRWRARISVGPPIYPLRRWRAGEVVRQPLPVDGAPGGGPHLPFWVASKAGRTVVATVSAEELRLPLAQWRARRLRAAARRHGADLAELKAISWREPKLAIRPLLERIAARIKRLLDRGLLDQAAHQLAVARESIDLRRVRDLSRRLSRRAQERAHEHLRRSQWPDVAAALRAASLAEPGSPWVQRRLAEVRARLLEKEHERRLIEELELELAQRAQALNPSAAGLARVMAAHLALAQAEEAMIAFWVWKQRVDKVGLRPRFLLAKALAQAGRLKRAMELLDRQLDTSPPARSSRSCPPLHPLEPLVLRARILHLARAAQERSRPEAALTGEPIDLGSGSLLLAHCLRSPPGEPVEVLLYLWNPEGRYPALDLLLGNRRRRLVLEGRQPPLVRLQVQMRMPPATYPVRLRSFARRQTIGEGKGVEIGSVTVGPEANFGFELPSFKSSWRVQGSAFGKAPVTGRGPRWHAVFGYAGARYADSYAGSGSDAPRGTLTSAPFILSKSHLMLLVAGGDDPRVGVDLVVDGRRELSVRGDRSMVFRPVFLPIGSYRGRRARIEVRDDSSHRWGFIAVDEIRQLDGPAPGIAP